MYKSFNGWKKCPICGGMNFVRLQDRNPKSSSFKQMVTWCLDCDWNDWDNSKEIKGEIK
jgi:hypothetical protein